MDLQSHTLTHASNFCSSRPFGFVTPAFAAGHLLSRPLVSDDEGPRFLPPSALGAPLSVVVITRGLLRRTDDPPRLERT